jgi:hypothetical protein
MPWSVESTDVDPLDRPLPVEPEVEPLAPVPLDTAPLPMEPDDPLEPVPLETDPLPMEPDEPLEPVPLDIEPLVAVPEVLPPVAEPPLELDLGDAAGFWLASCASRLHASKSACVGAASASPEVLTSVAAATSTHALMLRFMIDLPGGSELRTMPAARRRERASREVPARWTRKRRTSRSSAWRARSSPTERVVILQTGAVLRRRALPGYSAEREPPIHARVAKLADALDLGSSGE